MEKITGNEPINAFFEANEQGYGNAITIYDKDGGKQFIHYQNGITIRQHAQLEFMKALVSNSAWQHEFKVNDWGVDVQKIVHNATALTNAYIESLNDK